MITQLEGELRYLRGVVKTLTRNGAPPAHSEKWTEALPDSVAPKLMLGNGGGSGSGAGAGGGQQAASQGQGGAAGKRKKKVVLVRKAVRGRGARAQAAPTLRLGDVTDALALSGLPRIRAKSAAPKLLGYGTHDPLASTAFRSVKEHRQPLSVVGAGAGVEELVDAKIAKAMEDAEASASAFRPPSVPSVVGMPRLAAAVAAVAAQGRTGSGKGLAKQGTCAETDMDSDDDPWEGVGMGDVYSVRRGTPLLPGTL